MRKIIILLFINIGFSCFGQEQKKNIEDIKTKMDVFTSKTGVISKFIDYKLSNIGSTYSFAETRVRKVTNGNIIGYFYQIEKEGKYSSNIASIEYTDLLEVLKALKTLKSEVDSDVTSNPDYMENKFITVDGFQVGYFVSKGKPKWYIKLEKYGSDNTIFVDSVNIIETAFIEAKNKIEELKK